MSRVIFKSFSILLSAFALSAVSGCATLLAPPTEAYRVMETALPYAEVGDADGLREVFGAALSGPDLAKCIWSGFAWSARTPHSLLTGGNKNKS